MGAATRHHWSSYGLQTAPQSREEALLADRADILAGSRDLFVIDADGPIYMDGNSLGRQPRAAAGAVAQVLADWGTELVSAWERWADLPVVAGDEVGQLIGAGPGQVVVGDSTTVNLYKLALSVLQARPDRRAVIADAHDFPTARYVIQGIADASGGQVRWLRGPSDESAQMDELEANLDDQVALVCLSGVNFRSGALADMRGVARAAHRVGALVLWDLSHAAGVVPVRLDDDEADLAVGCGYKYLNGGPGAPSWLYVRAGLRSELRSPIRGWWGQAQQFEMGPAYEPMPGIRRFQAGTPPIMSIAALRAGIAPLLEVGMPALWHKTTALVELLDQQVNERLIPLGARLASPRDPLRRAGHLSIGHPRAWEIDRLLIDRRLVVPDFRPPDVLRLAPVALYTRFVDVWDAVEATAAVTADPEAAQPRPRRRVT